MTGTVSVSEIAFISVSSIFCAGLVSIVTWIGSGVLHISRLGLETASISPPVEPDPCSLHDSLLALVSGTSDSLSCMTGATGLSAVSWMIMLSNCSSC